MTLRRPVALLAAGVLTLAACTAETSTPSLAGESQAPASSAPSVEPSEEPAKSGSARLGSGGDVSMAQLPTLIAIERLNAMGYEIEWVEFEAPDNELAALAQGDLQMSAAGAAQQLSAIDAGLDTTFFLTRYLNEFTFVAANEIAACEDLDGQPVALHSRTGTSGTLTQLWVQENCPGTEPEYVIVEGSENQLIALLQGQVVAASIDMQNTLQLLNEAPDDFGILASHTEDLPVLGGVYSANAEWMAENETLILDFIQVHLDVWEEINDDPDVLLAKAQEELTEVDADLLPLLVERYLEFGIFPADGGITVEQVDLSMQVFGGAREGGWSTIAGYDDVADRSYLDSVLAERGG